MAKKEDGKLEIEDIKDPLDELDKKDVDLEEAVSEEPEKEVAAEEVEPEKAEEPDELEKAVAEPKPVPSEVEKPETLKEDKKAEKPAKDKKPFPWKTVAIVVITFLVTAALIMGGFYLYQKNNKPAEEVKEPTTTNNVQVNVTPPATTKSVYVTAQPTLNLRKDPNSTAQILTTIPFGTKLDVLATSGTWYKVTYNGQTGWVDATYTATANPLVYQNPDYKFEITFPSDWAGYKLFPMTPESGVTAAWYVGLPTKDTAYVPSGVDKGYANMFALVAYTPAQWATLKASGDPVMSTVAVQNQQWVITYSVPNGIMATDLKKQEAEVPTIVKTIKFY
jgi:uncharacterized protein YgiM (DUF1202 family)